MAARTLEEFVDAVRGYVEARAAEHADDRWWVLEPTLLSERRGVLHAGELRAAPDALRTLRREGPAGLPAVLGVRRAALALHVDLLRGTSVEPAIVLVIVTPLLTAIQSAPVMRTDLGHAAAGDVGAGGARRRRRALGGGRTGLRARRTSGAPRPRGAWSRGAAPECVVQRRFQAAPPRREQ